MNNYRIKMEKYLGRKLKSSEIIHHKDGNNYNNKLDNLEIVKSPKEHIKKSKKNRKIPKQLYIRMLDILNKSKEIDLKKALLTFFTPYQVTIIFRKLENKLLSKTDREVFSRSIKKKIQAIANKNLIELARQILF